MKTLQEKIHNKNRFNPSLGSGTIILGTIMMIVCFFLILAIFRVYEIQNQRAQTQIVCDAITNSAVVYGQDPFDLDENMVNDKARELVDINSGSLGGASNRIRFTVMGNPVIESLDEREGFKDYKVTLTLGSAYVSPMQIEGVFGTTDGFVSVSNTEVKAYAAVSANMKISAQDAKALQYALSHCSGIQKKAITKGALMIGWIYPTEENKEKGYGRWWTKQGSDGTWYGCRDCSSFVKTCYQDYTSLFAGASDAYTVSIRDLAKYHECLYRYGKPGGVTDKNIPSCNTSEEFFNQLEVGDILLFTGNKDHSEGIGHTAIYLGNGKIMHSIGRGVCIEDWPLRRGYHFFHKGSQMTNGFIPTTGSGHYDLIYIIRIPSSMTRGGSWGLYDFRPHA